MTWCLVYLFIDLQSLYNLQVINYAHVGFCNNAAFLSIHGHNWHKLWMLLFMICRSLKHDVLWNYLIFQAGQQYYQLLYTIINNPSRISMEMSRYFIGDKYQNAGLRFHDNTIYWQWVRLLVGCVHEYTVIVHFWYIVPVIELLDLLL